MFTQVIEQIKSLNIRQFLTVCGISVIVSSLSSITTSIANPSILGILGRVAIFVCNSIVFAAGLYISLLVLEENRTITDIIKDIDKSLLINLILLNLIISLALSVGFALFVIPGLICLFLTCLAPYILILERKGIVESLEESFSRVSSNIGIVLGILFLLTLIIVGTTLLSIILNPTSSIPVNAFFILTISTILSTITLYALYKAIKENSDSTQKISVESKDEDKQTNN